MVSRQPHFLGAMLGHELQQQKRLVDMAPVFLLVLQTPRNDAHDLLVVVNVIGSLCNLCRQGQPVTWLQNAQSLCQAGQEERMLNETFAATAARQAGAM